MREGTLKKKILRRAALLLLVITVGNLLPLTSGGAFCPQSSGGNLWLQAAGRLGGPMEVYAVTASGGKWKKKGGKIYYYDKKGKKLTGWWWIDGKCYCFDRSGAAYTGWHKFSDGWHWMGPDGWTRKGWQTIGGKKYWFDRKGIRQIGWKTIDGAAYHFDKNGVLSVSRWVSKSGSTVFVNGSGRIVPESKMTTAQYLAASKVGKKTSQIILVKDHNLTVWNKSGGTWKQGSVKSYCGYGRNGLKAASKRYAGDKTTPIGAWPLTLAFGKGSNPGTKMKYRRITKNSYWACTRSQYNSWVESKSYVPGEHLIDYYQYKYAMVIGFNMNPTVYGKGSGIFLHCKSTDHWWTAGCVSVPDGIMLNLMKTTKSGAFIVIVPNLKSLKKY
jgi:L,D-peptidoglycan transpeptidase YkuD (ErfK/YbiS/YcfS/YnhG family)